MILPFELHNDDDWLIYADFLEEMGCLVKADQMRAETAVEANASGWIYEWIYAGSIGSGVVIDVGGVAGVGGIVGVGGESAGAGVGGNRVVGGAGVGGAAAGADVGGAGEAAQGAAHYKGNYQ
jgi:hypothetical protein